MYILIFICTVLNIWVGYNMPEKKEINNIIKNLNNWILLILAFLKYKNVGSTSEVKVQMFTWWVSHQIEKVTTFNLPLSNSADLDISFVLHCFMFVWKIFAEIN